MAVESDKLGPGQLIIGDPNVTNDSRAWGAALTSATLTPETDKAETIDVLDGGTVSDGGNETTKFEGEVFQAYDMKSLLVWARDNRGREKPFSYRARNDRALSVAGRLTVASLSYGGDVKTRAKSKFTFPVASWEFYDPDDQPVITAATPSDAAALTTITVVGTNLGATTRVTVGDVSAAFTVVDRMTLAVTLPVGGSAGTTPIVASGWAGATNPFSYTRG